ncbi:hypothetical protein QVD17_19266 [Tagetes erecta]|uniref:Uncharacterized protein n=1 Tax=Tagetes erecta TaxID=13708 RepID=A0AAD8KQN6_TARER|nr:hypothetical protein QVD17_19266 [Tagetes erecta]
MMQEENKKEDINEFITEFNHTFETLLQVFKDCDEKSRDCHEHALVTQSKSDDNEDEEEYDWSEENDVVSIKDLVKKDIVISNLSETIAKQDETIAQLNSEIKRLVSEKELISECFVQKCLVHVETLNNT